MNLDQQITSLDLSKKLRELGIEQESLLSWIKKTNGSWVVTSYHGCSCWATSRGCVDYYEYEDYSAFNASELMELLPSRMIIPERKPFDHFRFNLSKSLIAEEGNIVSPAYVINYLCDTAHPQSFISIPMLQHNIWDRTLSNALAKTLIHLIENNFMEIKPCALDS